MKTITKILCIFGLCTLCIPALAAVNCAGLEKFKPGDNIDPYLKQTVLTCDAKWGIKMTPLESAISGMNSKPGNYYAVKAILDKQPNLATSKDYVNEKTMLELSIGNCCGSNNQQDEIAALLIENGAKTDIDAADCSSNNLYEKNCTLLDKTNNQIKHCNSKQCKSIKDLLINNGAQTYAQKHGGAANTKPEQPKADTSQPAPKKIETKTVSTSETPDARSSGEYTVVSDADYPNLKRILECTLYIPETVDGFKNNISINEPWVKNGNCKDVTNDKNAISAECKAQNANDNSIYQEYKERPLEITKIKSRFDALPKPDNGKIYRCMSTKCIDGYEPNDDGWCTPKQTSQPVETQTNTPTETQRQTSAPAANVNQSEVEQNPDTRQTTQQNNNTITVSGTVLDAEDNSPLGLVSLQAVDSDGSQILDSTQPIGTVSNYEGQFTFHTPLPQGAYIKVYVSGYQEITSLATENMTIKMERIQTSKNLKEVGITADRIICDKTMTNYEPDEHLVNGIIKTFTNENGQEIKKCCPETCENGYTPYNENPQDCKCELNIQPIPTPQPVAPAPVYVPQVNVFEILDPILQEHFTSSRRDVWKNDDGKFNTARLASDSIAGIVLGTTGGIVTSKIIKKNQLKRGFEALKCVIGGHEVANYGDEFTIGRN